MKTYLLILSLLVSSGLANAASQLKPDPDKPPRVYLESWRTSYQINSDGIWEDDYDTDGNMIESRTDKHDSGYSGFWENLQGGNGECFWSYDQTISDSPSYTGTGTAHYSFDWPALTDGTETYDFSYSWDDGHTGEESSTNTTGDPPVNYEYCEASYRYPSFWQSPDGRSEGGGTYSASRQAQTVWKLETGGKSGSQRKSLFCISATATEMGDLAMETYPTSPLTYIPGTAVGPIAPSRLKVGGWQLRSDGNYWVALSDNSSPIDVTSTVADSKFYTFSSPTAPKYTPHITANGANLDEQTPEFCVGQSVTFGLAWESGGMNVTPGYTNTLAHWHLPGEFVNEPYQYSPTCTSYRRNENLLTNLSTSCWYQNQPGGTASVRLGMDFPNGQFLSIAAGGNFSIYRPSVNPIVTYGPYGASPSALTNDWLSLENAPMRFDVTIKSRFPGAFGLTQLVNFYAQIIVFPPDVFRFWTTWGGFWLDGTEYYDGPKGETETCSINDPPGIPLDMLAGSYDGDWKTYVRFTPTGGIPVTLGRIDWGWAATCINTNPLISDTQLPSGWVLTSDGVDGPTQHDDDSFPVWSHVKPAPVGD